MTKFESFFVPFLFKKTIFLSKIFVYFALVFVPTDFHRLACNFLFFFSEKVNSPYNSDPMTSIFLALCKKMRENSSRIGRKFITCIPHLTKTQYHRRTDSPSPLVIVISCYATSQQCSI